MPNRRRVGISGGLEKSPKHNKWMGWNSRWLENSKKLNSQGVEKTIILKKFIFLIEYHRNCNKTEDIRYLISKIK